MSVVGPKNWIVFGHDQKWHDELANREAIKQHNIGCFYIWGGSVPTWDKLRCFARACPQIEKLAATTKKPFIYKVDFYRRVVPVPIP